jgi:hypothetical protein
MSLPEIEPRPNVWLHKHSISNNINHLTELTNVYSPVKTIYTHQYFFYIYKNILVDFIIYNILPKMDDMSITCCVYLSRFSDFIIVPFLIRSKLAKYLWNLGGLKFDHLHFRWFDLHLNTFFEEIVNLAMLSLDSNCGMYYTQNSVWSIRRGSAKILWLR